MTRRSGGHIRLSGGNILTPPALEDAAPDFSSLRSGDVRSAAETVLTQWTNELGDAIDVAETRAALVWIARAVEEAESGVAPQPKGPAASVLGRYLFDRLRTELVRRWSCASRSADADSMLTTLRAMEAVRTAIDPDWSRYFGARLAGPDGLDLVVDVAHDLRSPVTSILFLAETLSRGQSGELNDLQKRQMRLIYSAALGLSSMTSDVIELARGDDQMAEGEPSPLHVAEAIGGVLDIVRPIAEEKNLSLRFTAPTSDYRLGRPLALSRILLNLTTNALKFTDEGYVEIISRPVGRTRLEFSVRDTGHGIASDSLENLYQPFRRTRARAGRSGYFFSGTGLGLAMCRMLVEELGSELRLETRPGWGTRFYFELEMPPAGGL